MIQLLNQDSLVGMKELQDCSIDMVLADLPFSTTKNKWDCYIDLNTLWIELKRICKPKCPIVLFAVQPFTTQLIVSNPKGYRHQWMWNKHESGNFAVAKHMPLTIHEEILVFSTDGKKVNYFPQMVDGKMRNKGSSNSKKSGRGFGTIGQVQYSNDKYYPKSILDFPSVHRTHRLHASQKPVDLLNYLLHTYSKENDVILDCCAGSGSTAISCIETNRNFIGYELDKDIYDTAIRRIDNLLCSAVNREVLSVNKGD